jgi:hypothetical protein
VYYFLRIIADEQTRAVRSGGESSKTSDDSETGSSDGSDSETSGSSGSDGEAGNRNTDTESRARREREQDRIKDARKLFRWHGRQKGLAEQL